MDHSISLITTIAAAFGIALIFGFIAERMKIPALVGYLIAGILIGPSTPGFVADTDITSQLSEIGIMLLMFGVGLHFSFNDLLAVKRIAIPGAFIQMGIATLLTMILAGLWGWSWGSGLVLGLSLACASTVVLIKALETRGMLDTTYGRITIGWLVVEDLATVLFLVLLPPLADVLGGTSSLTRGGALWMNIGQTLLGVIAFIWLMLVVGRRVLPWLLWQVAQTGSRELFTLSVVVMAIGIAYTASELFKVSFALGAFFAGVVMRESEFSHHAAQEILPLRDAFSVLFFVAVGMLFQPAVLLEKPFHVLGIVAIIILGKFFAAFSIILLFRYSLTTALTVAAGLAQIGEFSFILAGLGVSLGVLPVEGMNLLLAGALISIALNTLLFAGIAPLKRWLLKYKFIRQLESSEERYDELPLGVGQKYREGHVILIGYGEIGHRIRDLLEVYNLPCVVIDKNRDVIENLRKKGVVALAGNVLDPNILIQAHIVDAAMLIVVTSDDLNMRELIPIAHGFNSTMDIVLRAHDKNEASFLRDEGIATVFSLEEELTKGMMSYILNRFGVNPS
jgi:CPA2 family monovalent cation:H+ antiporter-2